MTRLLIEEGLPFDAINEASRLEKGAGPLGHPFRIHRWWARRPLAMCRAIVLGSLVPDPNDDRRRQSVFNFLADAALFKSAAVPSRVDPLREEIRAAYPEGRPTVLDCFAGGGMIPLEALRLGCDATAVDLNPVAHIVQRCVVEFPQRYGRGLADDVRQWADWVEKRSHDDLRQFFPSGNSVARTTVWFWARTLPCQNPSCGIEIPLVATWWLARGRRRVWMSPSTESGGLEIEIRSSDERNQGTESNGTVKASSVTCPCCSSTIAARDVRLWAKANRFGTRLLAVLEETVDGRRYRSPTELDLEMADSAVEAVIQLDQLDDSESPLPDEMIDAAQARTMRMLVYGIHNYRDLFTPRQLVVAESFCRATRDAYAEMIRSGMEQGRAQAVTTYLGLIVSRIVGFNSSFATWENEGEKVRNTYSLQAIKMAWDFTEIHPFAGGSGSWTGGIEPVARAIEHCAAASDTPATVLRANAQALDAIPDASFDAVITDPPYYDAVQYADLSDFFYIWLKRSVGFLHPGLFSALLTPKSHEVIENRADKKSDAHISSEEFELRLARSIAEMRRVVKPDGVVTIVFAHTESDAWERLLRALLQAGLVVSTTWPMQSEMGSRSTANISAVLGSSVVLVCRPRTVEKSGYYDEVVRELDQRIAERLVEFEQLGLSGADFLISAIGPAFEVFGRYSSVRRLNDEEVSVADLLALARRTVARHAMRRLLGSEALGSVDDITLLYLTWRWAYGAARIPVDEAQKLGKAFHIEVDELGGIDGLAETSRESYGLRGPDERIRITLGPVPSIVDTLQLACQLHDTGRRRELAELLASTGFAEEAAFWATGRAIAESLPDGNRERTMLVNLLGGREQVVAAARETQPSEVMRLFDEAGR